LDVELYHERLYMNRIVISSNYGPGQALKSGFADSHYAKVNVTSISEIPEIPTGFGKTELQTIYRRASLPNYNTNSSLKNALCFLRWRRGD